MIYKICPAAGCNTLTHGGRCTTHRLPPRGHRHRQVRAQVLTDETTCWLCGGAPTPTDPLTLDHIVPRVDGGPTTRANGRAAHSSCNARRGAKHRGGVGQ